MFRYSKKLGLTARFGEAIGWPSRTTRGRLFPKQGCGLPWVVGQCVV